MHPKILNIEEAWNLYRTMGRFFDINTKDKTAKVIRDLMSRMSAGTFVGALSILYGDWMKEKDPAKVVMLFLTGLKENEMGAFHDFISRVTNNGKHSPTGVS